MTEGVKEQEAGVTWLQCRLLLGSKSPRRRELLSRLGLTCSVVEIDVEESLSGSVAVDKVAETLSRKKAEAYHGSLVPGDILVTADTVVVHGGAVLGKPHDRQQALEMLRSLSDKVHQVYTGVTLRTMDRMRSFTECTDVVFGELSEDEVRYYVDCYRPYDKAGAYGIQEWIGMIGVKRIEGCFYNVMGLPVSRLYKELKGLVD